MTNFETPNRSELPTTAQLNRATGLAALIAGAILVTTVLPAEYGIDPTGIGSVLGLKEMGDMKEAAHLAEQEPVASTAANAPVATATTSSLGVQTGNVTLTLQPGEGREVKATMKAGEEFDYSWSTDLNAVNYDQHGEVAGAASDEFTSYEKGTKASSSGKFRAPFDGTHGWYWRNRTDGPVTITVKATGQFEKFELKK
ncbi:hypothetical protein [Sphingorhabdus sp.]|uniref:hypothetical protein n=1 Tax=Sphingorhabdus sp. TaxID=1902408 RepID=UPI002FDB5DBA